jgi:hypothetical protein
MLKIEWFILYHSFRSFRPWSPGFILFGPIARQSIIAINIRQTKAAHLMMAKMQKRGRGARVSTSPSRVYPQCSNLLSLDPIIKDSTTSQWHHQLGTKTSTQGFWGSLQIKIITLSPWFWKPHVYLTMQNALSPSPRVPKLLTVSAQKSKSKVSFETIGKLWDPGK